MLTAFISPFGRFVFNKLPFGISSAPEHFQCKMQHILSGQEGTICHMDDMLIHGRDQHKHDARLTGALKQIQEARLTLNPDKCEFSQDKLVFLGHVIDRRDISPDPSKTHAVLEMESPHNHYRTAAFFWQWPISLASSLPNWQTYLGVQKDEDENY